MARRSKNGVNLSQAIRDEYAKHPEIKARDLIASLKSQGIEVKSNLVYLIKGKLKAEQGAQRTANRKAAKVAKAAASIGAGDAVGTILLVKKLAAELGGMPTLKAIVDALND